MGPDVWTAIFSGLTLAVFVITAVAALIQLRHLRMANSLTGLVTTLQDWQKPELQKWIDFIRFELPERMKDEHFVAQLRTSPVPRSEHPELNVCDYYEQVGSYVKYGMIDREAYLDVACATIVAFWQRLWPTILVMRETRGDSLYENFEYLAVLGQQWTDAHPDGAYPRGLPRWRELTKDEESRS